MEASDPWFCFADSASAPSLGGDVWQASQWRASASSCRAACDGSADCHAAAFDASSSSCTLLRNPRFTGASSSSSAGAGQDRASCVKTPQHRDFSLTGDSYGSLCFPGVDLGGVELATLPSPHSATSCAAACAQRPGGSCGHWRVRQGGWVHWGMLPG
jgi:hypothetical protein